MRNKDLSGGDKAAQGFPRFEVKPKACGFRAEVDVLRLNQLNEGLEIEDFQRKLDRDSAR